jgi:hypothetical protein
MDPKKVEELATLEKCFESKIHIHSFILFVDRGNTHKLPHGGHWVVVGRAAWLRGCTVGRWPIYNLANIIVYP